MSAEIEGVTICAYCHGPAAYLDARGPTARPCGSIRGAMEVICEKCARRDSARDGGQLAGALTMLNVAVKIAGDAGLSLDEVLEVAREAFDELWDLPEPNGPRWASGNLDDDTRFIPVGS